MVPVTRKGHVLFRDLIDVIWDLELEERRVLLVLAKRLLKGQQQYGALNLVSDSRDWRKEAAEETADRMIYLAFEEVAKHAK